MTFLAPSQRPHGVTDRVGPARRWAILILASAVLAALLEAIGLPAGLLLGPMIAAIAMAARGQGVAIPAAPFIAAQILIGCLVAAALDAGIVRTMIAHWPLFLGTTAATLGASVAIGATVARLNWLPASVAVWGTMPGAATMMVLMSASYGADSRMVAVMAYCRVVCVVGVASIFAAAFGAQGGAHPADSGWFAPVDWPMLALSLAVASLGAWIGLRLRLPAGALLGALILGAALHLGGLMTFRLPGWLLAMGYAVVGWRIGSNFTRDLLRTVARALPRILASVAVLIGFSAGLGMLLARIGHIDPVTAYLATSPGGLDSVAIIAASTRVDIPYVIALQMLRFVAVLLVGPALAGAMARRHGGRAAAAAAG